MTEETAPSIDPKDEVGKTAVLAQPDWFLQNLVRYANDWGIETGITLQVSGMLVSGTLISGKKYFDEFAESFSKGFKTAPELGASFHRLISSFKMIYEVDPEEKSDVPLPQYIHLRNARFFQPGQNPLPTNQAVLWRGRASEVGGFNLGSLTGS